jgi:hypothetical protein
LVSQNRSTAEQAHPLVTRLPKWEPCAHGTFGRGKERIQFYPVDGNGQVNEDSSTFAGHHQSVGDSGARGRNRRSSSICR